nr:carboxylesterase family protein [Streptomyces sp. SID4917]
MSSDSTIAQTASGKVRGRKVSGGVLFAGVPYAGPPVGARRYHPPVPPERWAGVRDTVSPGPACPQLVPDVSSMPHWARPGAVHSPTTLLPRRPPSAADALPRTVARGTTLRAKSAPTCSRSPPNRSASRPRFMGPPS